MEKLNIQIQQIFKFYIILLQEYVDGTNIGNLNIFFVVIKNDKFFFEKLQQNHVYGHVQVQLPKDYGVHRV